MKQKLSKLLSASGINNWGHYDDNNELSITVIDPKSLKLNRESYNSWIIEKDLTIVSDMEHTFHASISDIKDFVIDNHICIEDYSELVSYLDQLSCLQERVKYQATENAKKELEKIREYGFNVTQDWIVWSEYIPIYVILYFNKIIHVNSEEMKSLGYGITSFRVTNTDTIRGGIYCTGEHPNVSIGSSKFCSEQWSTHMKINLSNLVLLRGLMTHINMNNPYNRFRHTQKLGEYLNENQ